MKRLLVIAAALVLWWNWQDIRYSREVQHLLTQCQAQWEMAVSTIHQFEDKLGNAGHLGVEQMEDAFGAGGSRESHSGCYAGVGESDHQGRARGRCRGKGVRDSLERGVALAAM